MEIDLDALGTLAEVTAAFVAFAVIVASIRVTFGEKLTPFSLLLVHFFTESGMLTVTFPLFAIVLAEFEVGELLVAKATTWYALIMVIFYLIFYIRRRRRTTAYTPLLSVLNIVFWLVWVVILAVTVSEMFWQPSLAIIAALTFWGLISATVIFVSFLSAFLGAEDVDAT